MDVTVTSGSRSVMDCSTWATHSHPAFVERAYWKGAVASSTFFAICFAIVRATILLKMSPTTIPLTPPSGLLKAVMRPKRSASTISSGTPSHCEQRRYLKPPSVSHPHSPARGKRWSDVIPDGPRGSTPARLPQANQEFQWGPRWKVSAGCACCTSWLRTLLGTGGVF